MLPAGCAVRRASGTILRYATDQVCCYRYDSWWVARIGAPPVGFRACRADGSVRIFDDVEPDRADIYSRAGPRRRHLVRRPDARCRSRPARRGDCPRRGRCGRRGRAIPVPARHVEAARRSCPTLAALMRGGDPPFDGSRAALGWLVSPPIPRSGEADWMSGGTSTACRRSVSSGTTCVARAFVAASTTGGATPGLSACSQRAATTHQRSPGRGPGSGTPAAAWTGRCRPRCWCRGTPR